MIGYRSILDAAKSFAVDSDEPEIIDMEVNVSVYLNTQRLSYISSLGFQSYTENVFYLSEITVGCPSS